MGKLFQKNASKASIDNIYTLDGKVPILKAIPYGLQHVLAMFVTNIAPILIVSTYFELSAADSVRLIQTAMIVAGIGSLIQLFPIFRVGSRLPIVMGISFTFVSVFLAVPKDLGYGAVIGAVMIGGLIEGVLGIFAKYWRRIISPLVAACVVTAIGFSLLGIGADSFAGGFNAENPEAFGMWQNWVIGGVTLLTCILFNIFTKGPVKQLSVLAGLAVGYILAICMGQVDFSSVKEVSSIVSLPHLLPFKPKFDLGTIIATTMIFLVSATETIGDTSALAGSVLKREPTSKEISGSLMCDGLISTLSSCFGCMPITSFSQNIGLVAMTKVVNRITIATGAGIMILAGIFPMVGAVLRTLPASVLGGCTIMMFGTIVVSGLQMLSNCGFSQRNITIAALALSIGLGFTQVSDMFQHFPGIIRTVFGENCVAVVFLVALFLDLVMPKEKEETV